MTLPQFDPLPEQWPAIRTVGVDGLLISFADALSEPANRAALAFRAALDAEAPAGVEESTTSLVSVYLRFDPLHLSYEELRNTVLALLQMRDWYQAELPLGRRFWRIPTVYGTDLAPQLDEAAQVAGMTREAAIESLSTSRVRVQTIGFAPGQPYFGELPPAWDIPRQQALTERVPQGALVVAIRQAIIFSNATPTGWRHVGQTGFQLFRSDSDNPFMLRPGDEAVFEVTTPEELHNMQAAGPDGGARYEVIS